MEGRRGADGQRSIARRRFITHSANWGDSVKRRNEPRTVALARAVGSHHGGEALLERAHLRAGRRRRCGVWRRLGLWEVVPSGEAGSADDAMGPARANHTVRTSGAHRTHAGSTPACRACKCHRDQAPSTAPTCVAHTDSFPFPRATPGPPLVRTSFTPPHDLKFSSTIFRIIRRGAGDAAGAAGTAAIATVGGRVERTVRLCGAFWRAGARLTRESLTRARGKEPRK